LGGDPSPLIDINDNCFVHAVKDVEQKKLLTRVVLLRTVLHRGQRKHRRAVLGFIVGPGYPERNR